MPESLRSKVAEIIGEATGYGSLCWNPRPTGVFDSTEANEAVQEATDKILALLPQATEEVKECWDSKQFWGEYVKKDKRITELEEALKKIVEFRAMYIEIGEQAPEVFDIAQSALKGE